MNCYSTRIKFRQSGIKRTILIFIVSMFFSINPLKAQENSEIIYKDWLFVAESPNHVDVSARVVKCSEATANQVQIFIFNEGSERSDIRFTINISDVESGKSFNTEINHTVVRAEMVRAICDNDEKLKGLKINLPKEYNPNNIVISIDFK